MRNVTKGIKQQKLNHIKTRLKLGEGTTYSSDKDDLLNQKVIYDINN